MAAISAPSAKAVSVKPNVKLRRGTTTGQICTSFQYGQWHYRHHHHYHRKQQSVYCYYYLKTTDNGTRFYFVVVMVPPRPE